MNRRITILCFVLLALTIVLSRSARSQGIDVTKRPMPRLELEVPSGDNLTVGADKLYLPPGSSREYLGAVPSGSQSVVLPRTNNRPSVGVIWTEGPITLRLNNGVKLRLDNLIDRARVTFAKPDSHWRVVVEPLIVQNLLGSGTP